MPGDILRKWTEPKGSLSHASLSRKLKMQQLIVIAKVIDTGSLMRAANEMGLTQPAVTKAIQELEAFFDAPLFERLNRGVVPTQLGKVLGQRAKSMIAELRYLADEVNELQGGMSGRVIVGTLIAASAKLLPLTIAKLKEEAPGILITVREANTAQLFPALAIGDLDIVVGRLPEIELPLARAFPLRHEVLFQESMCVVVGARHRFDFPAGAQLKDLLNLPWIVPNAESPARARAEGLFARAGLPVPANRIESLSMLTNIGLLHQMLCLGLMPLAAAQQFVDAGLLAIVDLPESGDFGAIGYSVRAGKQISPACQRFIQCLSDSSKEIGHARRI
jgi:DNA-binding transcriptional LysR family regulator